MKSLGFKITDNTLNDFRKKLISGFWNKQEVVNDKTMKKDYDELQKLPIMEQKFILHILAFFASGDDAIIDIIYDKLMPLIKEDKTWQGYEIIKQANEHIHSETYAGLLDYLAPNNKDDLINAVGEYNFVLDKIKWCTKYLSKPNITIESVLLCLMITEQLFFSSSFCSIFWYKYVRGILMGLSLTNELISRDEGVHYQCGKYLFNKLRNNMKSEEIIEIISEAVIIEQEFVKKITPETIGMNSILLSQYVEFIADNILEDIGESKIYGVTNPFGFMGQFGLERKVDNFQRKTTGYSAYVVEEFIAL